MWWHVNPAMATLHLLSSWFDQISNRPSKRRKYHTLIIYQAPREKEKNIEKLIEFDALQQQQNHFQWIAIWCALSLIALCNFTRKIINSFKCCCRWLHLQIYILKLYDHHHHRKTSERIVIGLYLWVHMFDLVFECMSNMHINFSLSVA